MNSLFGAVCSRTPSITVVDGRQLVVAQTLYHRHPDTLETTTRHTTRHRYNAARQLTQSMDQRLHGYQTADPTVRPNLSKVYTLTSSIVHTDSVDAGASIALQDAAGRQAMTCSATGLKRTWQYEQAPLPGRELALLEQFQTEAGRVVERIRWADASTTQRQANLAGQRSHHYHTAGLDQTNAMSIIGKTASVTRQLLVAETFAGWSGDDASAWDAQLATKRFASRTQTDAAGAVIGLEDAVGNRQRHAYDLAGSPRCSWLTAKDTAERPVVSEISYSATGLKREEIHANGVVTTFTYQHEVDRLTRVKVQRPSGHPLGARLLQDLHYHYDPAGNLLQTEERALPTRFWRNQRIEPGNTYTYDSLYRLVTATGREMGQQRQASFPATTATVPFDDASAYSLYTRTYSYDSADNLTRIRHSAPANGNNYTTDLVVSSRSNRAVPSEWVQAFYEVDDHFDAGGNQLRLEGGPPLLWNGRGELNEVSRITRDGMPSDRETYRYAPHHQRALKTTMQRTAGLVRHKQVVYLDGLEIRTCHAAEQLLEALHVIEVRSADTAQIRLLQWEAGRPDGIDDHLRYSYTTLIGSASLEIDQDGQLISREEYFPFGGTSVWTARSQIEADYKTHRYSGQERDATGLYYYGYRYYQPWAGRWLSADPAGIIDGLNLYRMVRNNPMNLLDRQGLMPEGPLQENGLYEPRLRTGNSRDNAQAQRLPSPPDILSAAKLPATPIAVRQALTPDALDQSPLLTDLINPQKVPLSDAAKSVYSNRDGGGILPFTALQVTQGNRSYHALAIADSTMLAGQSAELAYWAPQGGYVDIPIAPANGDPHLLFTPGFSGCSLAVDQLDSGTLRVRHVQGGKEDPEYNQRSDHGLGLVNAMEYPDYGFHEETPGHWIENISGAAFMRYDASARQWNIHSQAIANNPGIARLEQTTTGLFTKRNVLNVTTQFSSQSRVLQSRSVGLRTANGG